MEPAFDLLLDHEQHALLGELTVILSQVEEVQIRTVGRVCGLDRAAANDLMKSTSAATMATVWSNAIHAKTSDKEVHRLVAHALTEIGPVFAARNEFVHGWYQQTLKGSAWGGRWGRTWGAAFGGKLTVEARRVKSQTPRPVSDLPAIRDQAACLSCVIAHIDHLLAGNPATTSPWLQQIP